MDVTDGSSHAIRSIIRLAFAVTLVFAAVSMLTAESPDSDSEHIIISGEYSYLVVSEEEKVAELYGVGSAIGISINVQMYVEDVGVTYTVIGVGDNLFAKSESIKGNVTSVHLPTTVTYISDNAFSGCSMIDSVEGMDNVSVIGSYAFFGCKALETMTILADVETIKVGTFQQCSSLKTIVLPSTIKRIENNAFQDCTALSELGTLENLTYIGDYAFSGCKQLSKVVMPDSVTSVGRNVYAGCSELKTVHISSQLTEITANMFMDCSKLETIDLSKNITWIGSKAFSKCIHLSEITLANTVKFIGVLAFDGVAFYTFDETEAITDYGDLPGYTYVHKSQSDEEWDGTMIRQELYAVHYDPCGGPTITDDEPHVAGYYFLPTRFVSGTLVCETWKYGDQTYHYGDQILMPGEDITLECVWTYEPNDPVVDPPKESDNTVLIIIGIFSAIIAVIATAFIMVKIIKRSRK